MIGLFKRSKRLWLKESCYKNPEDDQDDSDAADEESEENFISLESQDAMTEDDVESLEL